MELLQKLDYFIPAHRRVRVRQRRLPQVGTRRPNGVARQLQVECSLPRFLILGFLNSRIFNCRGNQVNLERRDCTLSDKRTRVPCVDVEVFMKYDGEGVPDRLGESGGNSALPAAEANPRSSTDVNRRRGEYTEYILIL